MKFAYKFIPWYLH